MHNQVNRNGGGEVAKLQLIQLALSQFIHNTYHAWERARLTDEVGVRKLNIEWNKLVIVIHYEAYLHSCTKLISNKI